MKILSKIDVEITVTNGQSAHESKFAAVLASRLQDELRFGDFQTFIKKQTASVFACRLVNSVF